MDETGGPDDWWSTGHRLVLKKPSAVPHPSTERRTKTRRWLGPILMGASVITAVVTGGHWLTAASTKAVHLGTTKRERQSLPRPAPTYYSPSLHRRSSPSRPTVARRATRLLQRVPQTGAAAGTANTSRGRSACSIAISVVEARGLFPAPGFVVVCPGYALGREGMTCLDVAGVCLGRAEIVIHLVEPFVVANEFENSQIFSGGPARCHYVDCGRLAYGF